MKRDYAEERGIWPHAAAGGGGRRTAGEGEGGREGVADRAVLSGTTKRRCVSQQTIPCRQMSPAQQITGGAGEGGEGEGGEDEE